MSGHDAILLIIGIDLGIAIECSARGDYRTGLQWFAVGAFACLALW